MSLKYASPSRDRRAGTPERPARQTAPGGPARSAAPPAAAPAIRTPARAPWAARCPPPGAGSPCGGSTRSRVLAAHRKLRRPAARPPALVAPAWGARGHADQRQGQRRRRGWRKRGRRRGARPVHLIITMIKWTRTSRLSPHGLAALVVHARGGVSRRRHSWRRGHAGRRAHARRTHAGRRSLGMARRRDARNVLKVP